MSVAAIILSNFGQSILPPDRLPFSFSICATTAVLGMDLKIVQSSRLAWTKLRVKLSLVKAPAKSVLKDLHCPGSSARDDQHVGTYRPDDGISESSCVS